MTGRSVPDLFPTFFSWLSSVGSLLRPLGPHVVAILNDYERFHSLIVYLIIPVSHDPLLFILDTVLSLVGT